MSYRVTTFLSLLISLCSSAVFTQTHFNFTANTGNNATIAVLTSINPKAGGTPLNAGDEIGVFAPSGLCAGSAVWTGANTAITVWGDNDVTSPVEGLQTGERLIYRAWSKSTNKEFSNVSVTYTRGTDSYTPNGIYVLGSFTASATAVEEKHGGVPAEYALMQNYPNPFNPATIIRYDIPTEANVSLKVYDIVGREVATLINEKQRAGEHRMVFDGRGLAGGVYLYRLQAGSFSDTRRLILLR